MKPRICRKIRPKTLDDEVEDELPEEIEMEPEEISSGVDLVRPMASRRSGFPGRM